LRAGAQARTIAVVEPFAIAFMLAWMAVGLVITVGRVPGYRPGRARAEDWQAAAEECGLANWSAMTIGNQRRLKATRGPLAISLSASVYSRSGGTKARLTGLLPWLEVRARVRDLGVGRGLSLGDPAFDGAFEVRGQRIAVQAMFDAGVRRRMVEIFTGDADSGADLVKWSDGRLTAQIDDGASETRASRLGEILASLLAIAEGLCAVEQPEARLAENARTDPLASFRLRCLEVLLQERPDHPATAATVRAALSDADGGVRLAAALVSPVEGRAILLDVARDPASSDAVASRALAAAGAAIEGDALELILGDALGAGKQATVAVCVDGLARDGAGRVSAIARVLESEVASHAAAAARALGATGAPAAAPALVRALAHADAAVREAAAASLGRVGAATDDVLALRRAEAAHPWEGTFLRAVRDAIASVQSRIVGADHGQLALAQPAGEVSLAQGDDARGRVSRDEP
jgi:HEAT repeats